MSIAQRQEIELLKQQVAELKARVAQLEGKPAEPKTLTLPEKRKSA